MRVSPFGHLRIKAYVRLPGAFRSLSRPSSLCAAPRSFSQLVASFVGSQCQGIRPALFFA